MVRSIEMLLCPQDTALVLCGHYNKKNSSFKTVLLALVSIIGSFTPFYALQTITEKHRMSFPETVDEILDVSEDEGRALK